MPILQYNQVAMPSMNIDYSTGLNAVTKGIGGLADALKGYGTYLTDQGSADLLRGAVQQKTADDLFNYLQSNPKGLSTADKNTLAKILEYNSQMPIDEANRLKNAELNEYNANGDIRSNLLDASLGGSDKGVYAQQKIARDRHLRASTIDRLMKDIKPADTRSTNATTAHTNEQTRGLRLSNDKEAEWQKLERLARPYINQYWTLKDKGKDTEAAQLLASNKYLQQLPSELFDKVGNIYGTNASNRFDTDEARNQTLLDAQAAQIKVQSDTPEVQRYLIEHAPFFNDLSPRQQYKTLKNAGLDTVGILDDATVKAAEEYQKNKNKVTEQKATTTTQKETASTNSSTPIVEQPINQIAGENIDPSVLDTTDDLINRLRTNLKNGTITPSDLTQYDTTSYTDAQLKAINTARAANGEAPLPANFNVYKQVGIAPSLFGRLLQSARNRNTGRTELGFFPKGLPDNTGTSVQLIPGSTVINQAAQEQQPHSSPNIPENASIKDIQKSPDLTLKQKRSAIYDRIINTDFINSEDIQRSNRYVIEDLTNKQQLYLSEPVVAINNAKETGGTKTLADATKDIVKDYLPTDTKSEDAYENQKDVYSNIASTLNVIKNAVKDKGASNEMAEVALKEALGTQRFSDHFDLQAHITDRVTKQAIEYLREYYSQRVQSNISRYKEFENIKKEITNISSEYEKAVEDMKKWATKTTTKNFIDEFTKARNLMIAKTKYKKIIERAYYLAHE